MYGLHPSLLDVKPDVALNANLTSQDIPVYQCEDLAYLGPDVIFETSQIAWLGFNPIAVIDPDSNATACVLRLRCASPNGVMRVIMAPGSAADVMVAENAQGTQNLTLRGNQDRFMPDHGRVLTFAGQLGQFALALVVCYAEPCQRNLTSIPTVRQGVDVKLEVTTVLLDGEMCLYQSPDCALTALPVSGINVRPLYDESREKWLHLGATVPVLFYDHRGQLMWPPFGNTARSSAEIVAGGEQFVSAFDPAGHTIVGVKGPLRIRSKPEVPVITAPIFLSFSCYASACPYNNSIAGTGDETLIEVSGFRLINADCKVPVFCTSPYRQLRLFHLDSSCRDMETACPQALDRTTDPEQYHNRSAPDCSSSLTSFALKPLFANSVLNYTCPLKLLIQCIRMCASPNRSTVNGEYLISSREYEADDTPTSIILTNDADGAEAKIKPGKDSGCSFQVRCRHPGEYVLWNVTGLQSAEDNLFFWMGTRSNKRYLANVQTAVALHELRVPILGSSSSLVIYEDSGAGTNSGFTANVTCALIPSFTCAVEPELVWTGEPVVRNHTGDIPFIDSCQWNFRCPANMYASVSVRYTGGYLEVYFRDEDEIDTFDSTHLAILDTTTKKVLVSLRSGQGTLFSDGPALFAHWNSSGIREQFNGSYEVRFDCWQAKCPLNITVPYTVPAPPLQWISTMLYRNGEPVEMRPSVERPWSYLNTKCFFEFTCPDATDTAYFEFVGPSGTGGYVDATSSGSAEKREFRFPTSAVPMDYGAFFHAPGVAIEWAGATVAAHSASFNFTLGCAPLPCSIDNFNPAAQELRVVEPSPPVPAPGGTEKLETGLDSAITDEADGFRYFLWEDCTIRRQCPDRPGMRLAVVMASALMLAADRLVITDPAEQDDSARVFDWPLALQQPGGLGQAPQRIQGAIRMKGNQIHVRVLTQLDGSRDQNFEGDAPMRPGELRWIALRCVQSVCATNLTSTHMKITVPSNASEASAAPPSAHIKYTYDPALGYGVQFHNLMRLDGAPLAWLQPYNDGCSWEVTCPRVTDRLMVRYAGLLAGNVTLQMGSRSMSDPNSLSLNGFIVLPAGETLRVAYNTSLRGMGKVEFSSVGRGGSGLLVAARCRSSACSFKDDSLGDTSPIVPVVHANGGDGSIASFDYNTASPEQWQLDARWHLRPKPLWLEPPFEPMTAAGDLCYFTFTCPNASHTPHAEYYGTNRIIHASPLGISFEIHETLGDDELGLYSLGTEANSTLVPRRIAPSAGFINGYYRGPRALQFYEEPPNPPVMGLGALPMAVQFAPLKSTFIIFRVTFRCFAGPCCNNFTQPVLLSDSTPAQARYPAHPSDPSLCPETTWNQNCTWVTPSCTGYSQALATYPVTKRLGVSYPPPGSPDLVGLSDFYALAVGYLGISYFYNYTIQDSDEYALFPRGGMIMGSCFVCNTSEITRPTNVSLASVGAVLPFAFSCGYKFRCDMFEFPRITLRPVGAFTESLPGLKTLLATLQPTISVRVDFWNYYPLHTSASNATQVFTLRLPVAHRMLRGLYGTASALDVWLSSVPVTAGRHAILFDLDFRCDLRPCATQSPVRPIDYSMQLGPAETDVDYYGIEKYVPWFPSNDILQVPLDFTAYGNQNCSWRYFPRCTTNCLVRSVFRLVANDWSRRSINSTEHGQWHAQSNDVAVLNPAWAAKFADSMTGADYMSIDLRGHGANFVPDDLSRANLEQTTSYNGEQNFTVTWRTSAVAVAITDAFPAVDWRFGLASLSATKTRSGVTRTQSKLTASGSRSDDISLSDLSPSLSTTNSEPLTPSTTWEPSITISPNSATASCSASDSVSNLPDVFVSVAPSSLDMETITGGLQSGFTQPQSRTVILRLVNSRFDVSPELLRGLSYATVTAFEERLSWLVQHPLDARSTPSRNAVRLQQLSLSFDPRSATQFQARAGDSLGSVLRELRSEIARVGSILRVSSSAGQSTLDLPPSYIAATAAGAPPAIAFDAHTLALSKSQSAFRSAVLFETPGSGKRATSTNTNQFAGRANAIVQSGSFVFVSAYWAVIELQQDSSYYTTESEQVNVRILPRMLTNKWASTVQPAVFTVNPSRRSTIPKNVMLGMFGAASGLAAASMSLKASINIGKNEFLLQLSPCDFNPTEVPSFLEYPVGIPVTDHVMQYRLGQVIFNPLVLLGIGLVHATIGIIVGECKQDREAGTGGLRAAAAAVSFPSWSLIPALLLYEPTFVAGLYIVAMDSEAGETDVHPAWRTAGIACVVGLLAVVAATALLLWRRFRAELSDSSPHKLNLFDRLFLGQRHWINRHLRPSRHQRRLLDYNRRRKLHRLRKYVVPDPEAEGFVERWGLFFDAYRPGATWYLLVELAQLTAVSVMSAFAPTDGNCETLTLIALIVFAFFFVVNFAVRPFLTPADATFQTLAAVIQLVACALICVGTFAIPSLDGMLIPIAEALVMALVAADTCKSVADIVVQIRGLRHESPPPTMLTRDDEQKLAKYLKDKTALGLNGTSRSGSSRRGAPAAGSSATTMTGLDANGLRELDSSEERDYIVRPAWAAPPRSVRPSSRGGGRRSRNRSPPSSTSSSNHFVVLALPADDEV
jgi:hypothetical protein